MKINKNILYYAIAIGALKGVSLLMLPIITRYLPPEQYGTLNFLVSISAMLSIFIGFGLAEVLFRFTAKQTCEQADILVGQCLKVSCVIAILFWCIALLSAPWVLSLLPVYVSILDFVLLITNLSLSVILANFLTRYRIHQNAKSYMFTAVFQGVLQASLTLLFLALNLGITGVLLSGMLASLVLTLLLTIKHCSLFVLQGFWLKPIHFKYGFSVALSALFLYGLGGAENWIIISKLGPEKLAQYFIACQFVLAVSLCFEPFRMWWFPIRFKRYYQKAVLAAQGAQLGCYVICLLAFTMMLLGPYLIEFFLPKSYHASSEYIPLLCCILVLKTFSELLNLGCYLEKTARTVPIINGICAVIAIVSVWWLIDLFSIDGVFYGLVIAHICRLLAFYVLSQQKVSLVYQHSRLLVMLACLVTVLMSTQQSGAYTLMIILFSILCATSFAVFQIQTSQLAFKQAQHDY